MIALYDENTDSLNVSKATDLTMLGSVIQMNPALEPLKKEVRYLNHPQKKSNIIGAENAAAVGETSGVLIIPMTLERYEIQFIGAIVIMKLSTGGIKR